MINIDYNFKYTIYFYILLSMLLYCLKPKLLFDDIGNFKQFGIDNDKTIFPFWIVTQFLSIFFYFLLVIKFNDYI